MHLLLIHQYFLNKSEGGGTRFNEMVELWSKAGIRITVITGNVHYSTGKRCITSSKAFILKEDYLPNVTVFRCHVSEAYNKNFIGRLWAYFSFVFSALLCGIFIFREKPDVLLATSPPLFIAIPAILLSKLKQCPFVFEVRDLWPESAIDTGIIRNPFIVWLSYALEKIAYRKAKMINVLTPAFKRVLMDKKGISEMKITMIPNAANFSEAELISNNFDRNEFLRKHGLIDKFIFIYVGAHGVANGLDLVIDVASSLNEEKILFLLIGSGMEKHKLEVKVKNQNLSNVLFFNQMPKNEVYKFILAADIGISILLKNETFKTVYSNKTFDYMACKKPILMAIDGVSRELVEQARCGIYVEPDNFSSFKNAVIHYFKNQELCKSYGENGYAYAKKHFDREKLALKYKELLCSVSKYPP